MNPGQTITAGEGWRLLESEETVVDGDECLLVPTPYGWNWQRCVATVGSEAGRWPTLRFRRRIDQPAASVTAVGDVAELMAELQSLAAQWTQAWKESNASLYECGYAGACQDHVRELNAILAKAERSDA